MIDSYAAIHESLNAVLRAFGKPDVSVAATRRMVGHGLQRLIEQAVGPERVDEGVRIFRASYARRKQIRSMTFAISRTATSCRAATW